MSCVESSDQVREKYLSHVLDCMKMLDVEEKEEISSISEIRELPQHTLTGIAESPLPLRTPHRRPCALDMLRDFFHL